MENMIDSLVDRMKKYDQNISNLTESQNNELDKILEKLQDNLPVYPSKTGVINNLVNDHLDLEAQMNVYKILEVMSDEDEISQNFLIPKYILRNIGLKKQKELYNSSN